jgi:hypothetical protein
MADRAGSVLAVVRRDGADPPGDRRHRRDPGRPGVVRGPRPWPAVGSTWWTSSIRPSVRASDASTGATGE